MVLLSDAALRFEDTEPSYVVRGAAFPLAMIWSAEVVGILFRALVVLNDV